MDTVIKTKYSSVERVLVFSLITCLVAMSEIASDIYMPSLPQIAKFFSISEAWASATVSFNLVGLGLSGFLWGPLSDKKGRRPILLTGTLIFVLASLGAWLSQRITVLLTFRLLQGVGAGAALPIGQASIQDLYPTDKSAKMLSRLGMVVALSPALGPVIGSYIVSHYDWHAVFQIVFLIGTILLIGLFLKLKETHLPEKTKTDSTYSGVYFSLLQNKHFFGYAAIQIFTITWLWAEVANLPFFFIETLGVTTANYGYFIALSVTIYIVGTWINQWAVVRLGAEKMIGIGVAGVFLGALALVTGHFFGLIHSGGMVVLLKSPASLGIAFIFGNTMSKALEAAKKSSGAAAAFISTFQMAFGSIGILMTSSFGNITILPLAATMLSLSVCSIIIFVLLNFVASTELGCSKV
jgi:MFS transporter, DHA1 family, multidrug resistance protein